MREITGSRGVRRSESESRREQEEEEEEEQPSAEGEEMDEEEEEEEEEEADNMEEEDGDARGNGHTPSRPAATTSSSFARSSKSESLSTLAFPISRVRRLVKSEVDVHFVGVEAGFLIAKAAEIFLEELAEKAFYKMSDDERTALSYKDVAALVNSANRLDFLSDFVPEPIPASIALSVRRQGGS